MLGPADRAKIKHAIDKVIGECRSIRWCGIGRAVHRIVMVWPPRGEARRIISMWKANEREIAKFAPASVGTF